MKKSFGLAKSFFIGVLAIGLFGLLGFAFAGTIGVNPGHPGSEICDNFFCVADNGKVGIGTMFPDTLLTLFIISYTNSDDYIKLISTNTPQTNLFFTKENSGPVDGSWVIRTNKDSIQDSGLPLKIGTKHQGANNRLDLELSGKLIFPDGTNQTTAGIGNTCVTYSGKKTGSSGAPQYVTVSCPDSSTRTGGGCARNPWATGSSYPSGDRSWTCAGGSSWTNLTAFAICCS